LMHRYRLAVLEDAIEAHGLDQAIAERRREAEITTVPAR
jgi:hypothetical protein